MPNLASSKKQLRTDARRTARNKSVRSLCKTKITQAEKLVSAGKADEARKAVLSASRSLDKAASRGNLHPNNATRRKARLVKKLNKIKS
ncbi:MAG: 30S ribosomal protein S20 [Dehalococcoidales bacterium]|nr:30S ribosomal protein S20 [Dehalococcoidales bacterium]